MKIFFSLTFLLIIMISGCAVNSEIRETPIEPDVRQENVKTGFWLDEETGTVHGIQADGEIEKAVSIIKYKNGKPVEVMKILSSGYKNDKMHWSYYVPSTQYAVELTVFSVNENEINIEWKNRSADGDEDSGTDRLLRCSENGFIPGYDNDSEDTDLPDDFSSPDFIE